MKRSFLYFLLVGIAVIATATPVAFYVANRPGWGPGHVRFTLPNGWAVSPTGRFVDLPGDMPGNILILDGGRQALVNTCGFHDHSLSLVDVQTGKILKSQTYPNSWIGLAKRGMKF